MLFVFFLVIGEILIENVYILIKIIIVLLTGWVANESNAVSMLIRKSLKSVLAQ